MSMYVIFSDKMEKCWGLWQILVDDQRLFIYFIHTKGWIINDPYYIPQRLLTWVQLVLVTVGFPFNILLSFHFYTVPRGYSCFSPKRDLYTIKIEESNLKQHPVFTFKINVIF